MKHLKKYNSRYPTHNENSQSDEYEYIRQISEDELERFTGIHISERFSKEKQKELFSWAKLLPYDSYSWERTISIPSTQTKLVINFSLKHVDDYKNKFRINLIAERYDDDWYLVVLAIYGKGIYEHRWYICDEYDSMLECLNNVFNEVSEKYMNVQIK